MTFNKHFTELIGCLFLSMTVGLITHLVDSILQDLVYFQGYSSLFLGSINSLQGTKLGEPFLQFWPRVQETSYPVEKIRKNIS